MLKSFRGFAILALVLSLWIGAIPAGAQLGNSGSIEGVVKDATGGAIASAKIEISNPVTGYRRETVTGSDGSFRFTNVPFNPYHLVVTADGFASYTQDADVRSTVPTAMQISLKVGSAAATSITVEGNGGDLVEKDPSFHTDVDTSLTERLPLESQSSSVSSLVTLMSPGVVADSNGLFHGLGDHTGNSFSFDGQPVPDQQSKVFSNQIPLDSIQSLEAVSGGPPAEYGDKTSLVIKVTTRSGLGVTKPTGSVFSSYGSFGSVSSGFRLAFGNQKWGNFIAANGLNTSRFLDPPELHAIHDKGNEENLFDRVDYQGTAADTIHTNLPYTRSWFQTPNTIDNLNRDPNATNPLTGAQLPAQDQRAQIKTFNIAPVWTRLISSTTLFTLGAFVRQDQFNYSPCSNVFADGTGLIPAGSSATLNQDRRLTNAGIRSDVSYVKGVNNIKVGGTFQHTFLTEKFNFGITDPNFLTSLGCPNGNPPPDPCAVLPPFDLTSGGTLFPFRGHTDVKELALYGQDTITKGNLAFYLETRYTIYPRIIHNYHPPPPTAITY